MKIDQHLTQSVLFVTLRADTAYQYLLQAAGLKAGTHYPCSRAVNTGVILDTREHGLC